VSVSIAPVVAVKKIVCQQSGRFFGAKTTFHPRLCFDELALMIPLFNMGVSKNRGKTPKWMVKIMENPYQNG